MRKRCSLLSLVVVVVIFLLLPVFCGAWLIGDFEIPAKKVKPKPKPVASTPATFSSASLSSTSTSRAGQTWRDSVTGMEFVWVPEGCFQMGSNSGGSDEKPVHKVCVDGFWMGKYEVTQGQWQKIMGNNPARFKKGDNYPVENVSWDDCQEFIKKLKARSSKDFRLPTEAEWEYACRAGSQTKYNWGDRISCEKAMYGNSSYCKDCRDYVRKKGLKNDCTAPVGSYSVNAFGLYDMHGNVWEWCSDWYDENYYRNSPKQNPQGPSSGSARVDRGGGWHYDVGLGRSANRYRIGPGDRDGNLGFRLVSPGRR